LHSNQKLDYSHAFDEWIFHAFLAASA